MLNNIHPSLKSLHTRQNLSKVKKVNLVFKINLIPAFALYVCEYNMLLYIRACTLFFMFKWNSNITHGRTCALKYIYYKKIEIHRAAPIYVYNPIAFIIFSRHWTKNRHVLREDDTHTHKHCEGGLSVCIFNFQSFWFGASIYPKCCCCQTIVERRMKEGVLLFGWFHLVLRIGFGLFYFYMFLLVCNLHILHIQNIQDTNVDY